MKKSTRYWLLGCGSGCAVLALVAGGLFAGTVRLMRDTTQPFESAIEARKTLEERFGDAADFTPWPGGAIPPDRLEAFLAVREATAEVRARVAGTFAVLPTSPEQAEELDSKPFLEKMHAVFDIARSSVGLGAGLGGFFEARNRALLDSGMGLGEYSYVYATVYYGWLGHSIRAAAEGLPMPNTASSRLRKELRGMLARQLAALPSDAEPAWRSRLAEEIAALESDPERLPWQDGLPAAVAASLEPYRESLATSFSPATNPFELGRNRKRGRWSIESE